MPGRKLSDAQIAEAIKLREQGWGCGSIGKRLGVSPGAILYQCLKAGAVSPRSYTARPCENEFVAWGGRRCRRFTPAEDLRLGELRASGATVAEICRQTGRAQTSVRIRLLQLAAREDVPA